MDPWGAAQANVDWRSSVSTSSGMKGWSGTALTVKSHSYARANWNTALFSGYESKSALAPAKCGYNYTIDPNTGEVNATWDGGAPLYYTPPEEPGTVDPTLGAGPDASDQNLRATAAASLSNAKAAIAFSIDSPAAGGGVGPINVSLPDTEESVTSYLELSTGVGVRTKRVKWKYKTESTWRDCPNDQGWVAVPHEDIVFTGNN